MKYLIIGAGGTGGPIGAYMTEAGKDVTMIARGKHLAAMRESGLRMETTKRGNYVVKPVKAMTMEEYLNSGESAEKPDVIFVCVKGYSLEDTVPFIRSAAGKDTVVIPILNIYGTGARLQEKLPELLVTDGCIYVAAEIRESGCIWMNGDIFRIVFGVRDQADYRPVLERVAADLEESGITPILTDHIRRDAFKKFTYVSPAAACGEYYNAAAGAMQKPGEIRDTFAALIRETMALANAMNLGIEEDMAAVNLEILDHLTPHASTSMQRDIAKGGASEVDGLVYEVVRMAERYGAEVPTYRMIAEELKRRGL